MCGITGFFNFKKNIREENKILKQQQFEQDEMIIENAFAIANIELGGL